MTTVFSTAPVRETTDSGDTPVRILVTGFISTEIGLNASDILIRSLMSDLPSSLSAANHLFHFCLIDANTHNLRFKLQKLLAEVCPSMCVFVGQAPGRNNVTLESSATNLRFTGPPLSPGGAPQSDVILASGPESYPATLPHMQSIVEKLRGTGIPAAMSDDAGNSLCNQILYEGLQYGQQHAGTPRCGFVHIPALPQQVIERWPDYPFMPLDMQRVAMSIILFALTQDG